MKVLYHLHAYVPEHNAGAEWMAHAILKWLVKEGHECHVITTCEANYEYDGVKVYQDDFDNCNREWRWCDVGLTHLVRAGKAWNWSHEVNKPIVYVVHNTFTNRLVEVKQNFALIFNTDWAKVDAVNKGYKHKNIVLHPPVWVEDYKTDRKGAEYITLINCWDRKGGHVLAELARLMPDQKFLGVLGGYGEQVQAVLPNLEYIENTPDIKSVYQRTKLLIMPSVYESYGRTAVEAMCSGIPVIASGTPGLRESLDDCGTFCSEVSEPHQLKPEEFKEKIYQLFNETLYNELSLKSLKRAEELEKRSIKELKNLVKWLQNLSH